LRSEPAAGSAIRQDILPGSRDLLNISDGCIHRFEPLISAKKVYLISGFGDNSTGRQPTTDSLTTNRSVKIGVMSGSFQEVFELDVLPIDRPSPFEILSL
jgi:hypothetical protein